MQAFFLTLLFLYCACCELWMQKYLFRRNSTGLPKSHASTGNKKTQLGQNNGTRKQAQGLSYLLQLHRCTKRVVKAIRFCTGGVDTGAVARDSSLSFPDEARPENEEL